MATEIERFAPLYAKPPGVSPYEPFIGMMRHSHGNFAPIPQDTELTRTLNREDIIGRIFTRMVDGKIVAGSDLAELMDNYPLGIFTKSDVATIIREGAIHRADPDDISGVMSYIMPRMVHHTHFQALNNAEIHFTDSAKDFYADKSKKYVPNNRTRVYSHYVDENGKNHFTYLLRHSIKENYTDIFELFSFAGFIEVARAYAKTHPNAEISAAVKNLANGQPMSLSRTGMRLKHIWEVASGKNEVPDSMRQAAEVIQNELKRHDIQTPKHVMFGNDFSVPLLIGTGVIEPHEFDYIIQIAEQEARTNNVKSKIVSDEEMKGLRSDDDRLIMKQFSALQYLNRFQSGQDVVMDQLKQALDTEATKVRRRIVQPTSTALGSTVDVIDFKELADDIICKIDNKEIQGIVRRAKQMGFSYLSLPYPLGDSVHGLVRAFKHILHVDSYGFFGKVGGVPMLDDRLRRGRVVISEKTTVMSAQTNYPEKKGLRRYPNGIKAEDTIIISRGDVHRVLVTVNGITMQSLEDYLRLKILVKKLNEDNTFSSLLLDMEADTFNAVCQSLGIVPDAIYYVSDLTCEKTPNPYAKVNNGENETIVKSLGAEGTLASVVTPFTILNVWITRKEQTLNTALFFSSASPKPNSIIRSDSPNVIQ